MAMPKIPIDPHCPRQSGKATRISRQDSREPMRTLAIYARGLGGVQVWEYPDGKVGLKGGRLERTFGPDTPFVFGTEGQSAEQAAAQAYKALRHMSHQLQKQAELERAQRQAVEQGHLTPQEPPLALEHIEGVGQVMRTLQVRPAIGEVGRDTTGRRTLLDRIAGGSWWVPVASALSRLSTGGRRLQMGLMRRNEVARRVLGESFAVLNQSLRELEQADPSGELIRRGYQRWVERDELRYMDILPDGTQQVFDHTKHKALLERTYEVLNKIDNQMYDAAVALGIDVKPRIKAGDRSSPTGRYMPHKFDMVALSDMRTTEGLLIETAKAAGISADDALGLYRDQIEAILERQGLGSSRDAMIRKMIKQADERGRALTRSEAGQIIDRYIRPNADRLAGGLEKNRLGVDGYITDLRRAYVASWTEKAYRLANVGVFGKRHKLAHELLDQIERETNPSGSAFARRVYDLEMGVDRTLFHSPVLKELYHWQAAKLSLGFLPNLGQSVNTAMVVGMRPMLHAMAQAAKRPRQLVKEAERRGTLPTNMFQSHASSDYLTSLLGDMQEQGFSAAIAGMKDGSFQSHVMQQVQRGKNKALNMLLWPFRVVEGMNRVVAERGGEFYFKELLSTLQRDGDRALTNPTFLARFEQLDMDPRMVLDALRQGDQPLLDELSVLAGLRVSDNTQFLSDIQGSPLFANHSEIGKVAFQFKNFPLNQMRFIMRELSPEMYKTDRARFLRAAAMVTTVYPAVGMVLTGARSLFMGPTVASDFMAEKWEDANIQSFEGQVALLQAGAAAMVMAGSLGIMADMAFTALLGNSFATRSFLIVPTASTVINGLDIAASTVRAIASGGDPDELRRASTSLSREFGGIGALMQESVINPAVFGVTRQDLERRSGR